jgi:hypothetical protein
MANIARTICAAALLCAAAGASAQTIFKHVAPDGRVTYTDHANARPESLALAGIPAARPAQAPERAAPALTPERAALIDANEAHRVARAAASARAGRGHWLGGTDLATLGRLAPVQLASAAIPARAAR